MGKGSEFSVYIPQNIVVYREDEWMQDEAEQTMAERVDVLTDGVQYEAKEKNEKETDTDTVIPLSRKREYLLLKIMKISDNI